MASFSLKCDICGGQLGMDSSLEFATCERCGMKYGKAALQEKFQAGSRSNVDSTDVPVRQTDFAIRAGVLEKYNGALTQVTIPENVSIIGEEAFKECIGLTRVVIPENVREIHTEAFSWCRNLESVILSNGLLSIGVQAFSECGKLTEITFPESLQTINAGAFGNADIMQLVIPSSVKEIRGDNYNWGAFTNCKNLKSVILQDGLEVIEDKTFWGCESLTEITIPKTVRIIGDNAFNGCSHLRKVTLQDGLQEIGKLAFAGTAITSITIPKTVKKIGGFAFSCDNLTSLSGNYMPFLDLDNIFHKTPALRNMGVCQYCGGEFKGVFQKTCKKCGRSKDY